MPIRSRKPSWTAATCCTYHQAFIDLIDRPPVFDLILDLMGPYIQFSMSQAIIRASTEMFPGYTHTDGGEAQRAIRVTETSRPLAVKVMYLLTDVTEPDSGNFTIFPGSHLQAVPGAGRAHPQSAHAGRGAAARQGGRRLRPARALARPGAQPLGQGAQDHLYNYSQMFMRP